MDKQSKRIEDFIKKASRQVSFNNGQMKEKEFSSNEGLGRLNFSEEQMKETKDNLNLDTLEQIGEEINSEARNEGIFKNCTVSKTFSLKDYLMDNDMIKDISNKEGTFKNVSEEADIALPDIFNVDKIKNSSFDLVEGENCNEEETDIELNNNIESSMDDDFEYEEEEL